LPTFHQDMFYKFP